MIRRLDAQREVAEIVRDAVVARAATAAAALVGDGQEPLVEASAGVRRWGERSVPTTSSLFDLASLAKPLTATLALRLAALGELPLATRLGDVWTRVDERMARLSLESLLRHRSGLAAWWPLWVRCARPSDAAKLLLSGAVLEGARPRYSDLGYMLWGWSAQEALGLSPLELLRRHVLRPLEILRDVRPGPASGARVVECRLDNRREVDLARELGIPLPGARPGLGEAQDGNARWLRTYVGHAGLFGSARAMWRLGREWLCPHLLPSPLVERALGGRARLRLGWWSRRIRGAAGPALHATTFGHTGFTGGSLWIDPSSRRIYVFLAHRTSGDLSLDPWRHRLHRLA